MDYDQNDDDRPVGQRLRCVSLLDITPGRAMDPETGVPIGILTFTFKGELEQSLSISMKDLRRLAIGCLAAVAHHEGGIADEIVRRYFVKPDGTASFSALDPAKGSTPSEQPQVVHDINVAPTKQSQPIISYTATMKFADNKIKPVELGVIAGYRHDEQTLLVCQCSDLGDPVISLGLVGPRRTISMLKNVDPAVLKTATKMTTVSIDVAGERYRRLTVQQFRRAVGNGKFTFRPPRTPKKRS